MKRLNNRGFAISTLLYGIMIMSLLVVVAYLGNLSTDRQNTKAFVDKIEDELNRLGTSSTEGGHEGGEVDSNGREYIAPNDGWYKIELWGAAGKNGGRGSYVSGIMYMKANDYFYVYVGGVGGSANTFNSGSTGGGATDVRLVPGDWNDSESLNTRIMVAAGGGSGTTNSGGALIGFGSGYGQQTTGAGFGKATGSGGGGWYGGSSGGGSSIALGYAGSVADSGNKTVTKTFTMFLGNYDSSGNPITESLTPKIYDVLMVEGVNEGEGKFKITQISSNAENDPPRKGMNSKLNNVQYIRDCVTGNTSENTGYWQEIQAISDGVNRALGKNGNVTNGSIVDGTPYKLTSSTKCVTINLGGRYNLDEIAVWHRFNNSTSPSYYAKGHTLEVSANGSSWTLLRKTTSGQINEKETSNGIHYHSMQIDSMSEIPEGNYYIFPADSYNNVLTSYNQGSLDVVAKQLFGPTEKQIWHVYKDSSGQYKIESTYDRTVWRYNAGRVELVDGSKNLSGTSFNITPLNNGYYSITSGSTYMEASGSGGMLQGKGNNTGNSLSQRYKFVLSDY